LLVEAESYQATDAAHESAAMPVICGDCKRLYQNQQVNRHAFRLQLPGHLKCHESSIARASQHVRPLRLDGAHSLQVCGYKGVECRRHSGIHSTWIYCIKRLVGTQLMRNISIPKPQFPSVIVVCASQVISVQKE
jgi:hypothetical protein